MMFCFVLLTQEVSTSGSNPPCSTAKSASACMKKKADSPKFICKWKGSRCTQVHHSEGDINVDEYSMNDLLEDVNRFIDEW